MRRLRIAILAHSTNPRGGVVHALAVAEALTDLGHEAVVHAPDPKGAGFFRPARCATVSVETSHAGPSLHDLVTTRIADYVRYFECPANRDFDVFHAQDGISGNALATLTELGAIEQFARTVHHIDTFEDGRVDALQTRSIETARSHFVVSAHWRGVLHQSFGVQADLIGNGVDRTEFSATPDRRDLELRAKFGFGAEPVFLAIGGVEPRKNTLNVLRAFDQVRALHQNARLVIAGGSSLLDHKTYQAEFRAELERLRATARNVVVIGPVNQADVPPLYRIASALVFPSTKEGFGLVALEAIACGTPVITSRIAPFTEHFGDEDVVWCDPHNPGSIANAMALSLQPEVQLKLSRHREKALSRHSWDRVAAAHMPTYERLLGAQYA